MTLSEKFSGTGVAIITPFTENGDIDFPALEKLVNHLVQGKVDYLVVLGTTGENATLSFTEKQSVFSAVADFNKSRLLLMAGIGGNHTAEVAASMQKFNLSGYEAILSVSPYYNKPSQHGIFEHYRIINEATPLPVMMYNVPSRTGSNVTAETTLRIAENCPNIFATKEASGNLEQVMHLLKYKPESFMVISGDDALTLPMIALGARGVVSVVANAYPFAFSEMVRLCLKGNFEAARLIHYQYLDIINSMFLEGSPGGVKAYLSEMGICKNQFRLPVYPVSPKHMQVIKQLMQSVKE